MHEEQQQHYVDSVEQSPLCPTCWSSSLLTISAAIVGGGSFGDDSSSVVRRRRRWFFGIYIVWQGMGVGFTAIHPSVPLDLSLYICACHVLSSKFPLSMREQSF